MFRFISIIFVSFGLFLPCSVLQMRVITSLIEFCYLYLFVLVAGQMFHNEAISALKRAQSDAGPQEASHGCGLCQWSSPSGQGPGSSSPNCIACSAPTGTSLRFEVSEQSPFPLNRRQLPAKPSNRRPFAFMEISQLNAFTVLYGLNLILPALYSFVILQ